MSRALLRALASACLIACLAASGCARKRSVVTPDGVEREVLAKDGERYLQLLQLREEGRVDELLALLDKELERRLERRDYEGCVHAAGDIATLAFERGDDERAGEALATFGRCHTKGGGGSASDFVAKTAMIDYRNYQSRFPEEQGSPTLACTEQACDVQQISNYFSWSRPLEDFVFKGRPVKRGDAVFVSVMGTVMFWELFSGYGTARRLFRGTMRYERPEDPGVHFRELVGGLLGTLDELAAEGGREKLHARAITALRAVPGSEDYRVRVGLVYNQPKIVAQAFADIPGLGPREIEQMRYFEDLERFVPEEQRVEALASAEPYFYEHARAELEPEAVNLYLYYFEDLPRAEQIRELGVAIEELEIAKEWGPAAVLAYSHRYAGTLMFPAAKAYLDDYVRDKVSVLESHLLVADGEPNWVSDWVSDEPVLYGGDNVDIYIYGAYVNRGDIELPVRLNCNFHMVFSVEVQTLFGGSKSSERMERQRVFEAYLPPGKPRIFICALEQQQAGVGISAGIIGGMAGYIDFQDPPFSIDLQYEAGGISTERLEAQRELMREIERSDALVTQVRSWKASEARAAGEGQAMVHYYFYNLPKRFSGRLTVSHAGSGKRALSAKMSAKQPVARGALTHGDYLLSLPQAKVKCAFTASGREVHVVVDGAQKNCHVRKQ